MPLCSQESFKDSHRLKLAEFVVAAAAGFLCLHNFI